MKIVALEGHFATAEVMQGWKSVDSRWSDLALKPSTEGEGARRLLDHGAERLDAMNEAGVDVAVLSLTTPGVQNLDAKVAVDLARSSNDHLAPAVHITPERFQGFATLPTPSPDRAAKELVRCIRELDLHGAMLHGRTRDQNLSEQEFGPIFEAAEALGSTLPAPAITTAGRAGRILQRVRRGHRLFVCARGDWLALRNRNSDHPHDTGRSLRPLSKSNHRYRALGEIVLFYLDRADMLSGA